MIPALTGLPYYRDTFPPSPRWLVTGSARSWPTSDSTGHAN